MMVAISKLGGQQGLGSGKSDADNRAAGRRLILELPRARPCQVSVMATPVRERYELIERSEIKEVRSEQHPIVRRGSRRKEKAATPARHPIGLRIIRAGGNQSCQSPVGLANGVRNIGGPLGPPKLPSYVDGSRVLAFHGGRSELCRWAKQRHQVFGPQENTVQRLSSSAFTAYLTSFSISALIALPQMS